MDISAGAIVVVKPKNNRVTNVNFQFQFAVLATPYEWWEQFFVGPDNLTYFWSAVGIAGFIALILLIAIIASIVKCC